MNIKSEYRKYKIAKLFNTDNKSGLFDFAVSKLIGLTCHEHDDYPEYLLYGKSEKEIIFYYDTKTGYLWIDQDRLWSVFRSKYLLNDQQINELCGCVLRDAYKLKVVATVFLR